MAFSGDEGVTTVEDPEVIFRAIERLSGVLIGGLSIWFGYRLFLAIPAHPSEGTAELSWAKDKRIVLTRIGPGVFFALFGCVTLIFSYLNPIQSGDFRGFASMERAGAGQRPVDATGPASLPVTEAIRLLNFLGDAERRLATATDDDALRNYDATRFEDAKLAILPRAWQEEWGNPEAFENWVREGQAREANDRFKAPMALLKGKDP